MTLLDSRDKKKGIKTGPVYSKNNIPYDYIVIIDSGSKGSRVYVYNWLNPLFALEKGYDLKKSNSNDLKLLAKYDLDDSDDGNHNSDAESDFETDHKEIKFPSIKTNKKWHKKIKPGISTFMESPQKVGKRHLKHLLNLASNVVPKSQHYRTPLFLHSTGGMRLLKHMDQEIILDSICKYFTRNSDFYLPDCASHVNIIDGDVEGLYGWLSINYLVGSFDFPTDHEHGKNHTTYGLLDMGGASTQVVFSPNSSEIEEHQNNLYKIKLSSLPELEVNGSEFSYENPRTYEYSVYSDSFLGFGMYQAYHKYLSYLIESYKKEHGINGESRYSRISNPISDPCLPKGYTTKTTEGDISADFTGSSNFEQCLTSIFPLLSNSTYATGQESANRNCKQFSEGDEVSACLFYDMIPSFDFDINHFFGVSGYEDSIKNLLAYDTIDESQKEKGSKNPAEKGKHGERYDYKVIYDKTSNVCSSSFSELIELNNRKSNSQKLSQEDLAQLCFKSSWILNFLHLGLGFPRFGIDDTDQESKRFESLQLTEAVDGSPFSWTLGRAILYANDEYVQAFENFTKSHNISNNNNIILSRPGFYFTASSGVYNFGAENNGISRRPLFTTPNEDATYKYYDYEYKTDNNPNESKWYIQPHRWNGIFMYIVLFSLIIWLMIGKNARSEIFTKVKSYIRRSFHYISQLLRVKQFNRYTALSDLELSRVELEACDYELDNMPDDNQNKDIDSQDQFKIVSDEE